MLAKIAGQSTEAGRMSKTLAYFATFISLGLAGVILGPTLQGLAGHLGVTLSAISILFPARSLGYVSGSFAGGLLYDRRSGNPILAAMLLVMAAMLVVVPVAPVLWLAAAALFVLGIAEGAVDVGCNTLLVWTHGRQVGPYMNALHFFWGLGAFLSPIIIAQALVRSGDITAGYWLIAILMLPPAIMLARQASPDRDVPSDDRPAASAQLAPVFFILVFYFMYVGAEGSFGAWIYSYATAMGQASKTTAAYLTSAFWGALMIGRLISIPIAHRLSPHIILAVDSIGCLASVGLLLMAPQSAAATWAGTIGLGLFMASMFPTMIAFAEQRMAISGKLTGAFLVSSALGGMTVAWLIGQVFESMGPQITMVIEFITVTLMGLSFLAAYLLSARPVGPLAQDSNAEPVLEPHGTVD
jgi:MFS transporter, FHS family, Na+ dependent glucose transporter 1